MAASKVERSTERLELESSTAVQSSPSKSFDQKLAFPNGLAARKSEKALGEEPMMPKRQTLSGESLSVNRPSRIASGRTPNDYNE